MPKKWTWLRFDGSYVYLFVERRHVLEIVTALTLAVIDFHVIYPPSGAAICVQDKERYRAVVEEAYDKARNKNEL